MTDAQFLPETVLGVAAHPDDLEFGVAGSIAHWTQQGARAYYLILTNGNKGSEDRTLSPEQLRDIRRSEQEEAARVLGVEQVFFCDFHDGELEVTMDVKREIARIIRTVKPDTVMTMDPSMLFSVERGFINHPDHRAAGQATLDAVFPLARDHLSFPELLRDEGLEPHKTKTLLLNNFDRTNFVVDISDSIERKLDALKAHASQIPDVDGAIQRVTEMASKAAEGTDFTYGEAFLRIDVQ